MTLGDRVGIAGLDGAVVGFVVGLVTFMLSSSIWVTVVAALVAAIPVVVWADRFWALFEREAENQADLADRGE